MKHLRLIVMLFLGFYLLFGTANICLAESEEVKWSGDFGYIDYADGVCIVSIVPLRDYGEKGYWDIEDIVVGDYICNIPQQLDGKKVIKIEPLSSDYEDTTGRVFKYSEYYSVKELILPETLKYIGDYAFQELDISECKLPDSVEEIGDYAFAKNKKLKTITMSSNLRYIGYRAFLKCWELQGMRFPEKLEVIGGYAFAECRSLTSVYIPASVRKIGNYAFSDCRSVNAYRVEDGNSQYLSYQDILCEKNQVRYEYVKAENEEDEQRIEIPITYILQYPCGKKGDFHIEKNMDMYPLALMNALGITGITVDAENPNYSSENGVLFNKEKTTLINFPCDKTGEYEIPSTVELLQHSAFSNSKLSKIIIPDNVKYLSEYSFYQCSQLESIYIGKNMIYLDNEDLATCQNLKEMIISDENEKFISINNVVYDKKVESVVFCPRGYEGVFCFPDTVKKFRESAFSYEDNLDGREYKCDRITGWIFGEEMEDALSAVRFCSGSVEISEKNHNYRAVDGLLYSYDMKMLLRCPIEKKEVTVPDGVKQIRSGCFHDDAIDSIRLPRSLVYIDQGSNLMGKIYGYAGSAAEQYAKANGCEFIKIDETGAMLGDINGDDKITLMDVVKLRKFMVGGYDVTVDQQQADVNMDGKISMMDIILLRKYVVGGYGVILGEQPDASISNQTNDEEDDEDDDDDEDDNDNNKALYTLSGVLKSKGGEVIQENIKLYFFNEDGEGTWTRLKDGNYTINLEPGIYEVELDTDKTESDIWEKIGEVEIKDAPVQKDFIYDGYYITGTCMRGQDLPITDWICLRANIKRKILDNTSGDEPQYTTTWINQEINRFKPDDTGHFWTLCPAWLSDDMVEEGKLEFKTANAGIVLATMESIRDDMKDVQWRKDYFIVNGNIFKNGEFSYGADYIENSKACSVDEEKDGVYAFTKKYYRNRFDECIGCKYSLYVEPGTYKLSTKISDSTNQVTVDRDIDSFDFQFDFDVYKVTICVNHTGEAGDTVDEDPSFYVYKDGKDFCTLHLDGYDGEREVVYLPAGDYEIRVSQEDTWRDLKIKSFTVENEDIQMDINY